MIQCLSSEVQAKLRSGVAIPSLQQCVEELVLNSIDAEATCVGVRMDLEGFKVQVIDNGAGMTSEDMGRVGRRYHTSKCSSMDDLDHLRFYGFRGEAVASVVSLASLVEISSRAKSSAETLVKVFKDGKGLPVFEAQAGRPSAGTTFIICNFFHNMPVRRRRMDAVLEGERIRHRLEAVSLMHPSVSFTLKNDCTGAMMVQLPKARDTYHRFVQIHGLGRAQKLAEVTHTHARFEVSGHLGREGHYNNTLQFLYVNGRLLLRTRLHKLLNLLLRRLSSSTQKNDSPDGQPATRSPRKRSQELHGVYVINIKCPYEEYDVCLEPAKTLIEFRDWDGVLLCVEEAVKAFLRRENLVAELSQDDLDSVSPQVFPSGIADGSKGAEADCGGGALLASRSVYRKCTAVSEGLEGEGVNTEEQEGGEELESSGESRDDPAGLEPACDRTERTLSDAEGGDEGESSLSVSPRSGKSPQGHLDSGSTEVSDCRDAEPEQTLRSDQTISLSSPYVHQIFQARPTHEAKASDPQGSSANSDATSKQKTSLDRGVRRPHTDSPRVVPPKVPRTISVRAELGSLDKFRRLYGKSNELQALSLGAGAALPQPDSSVNPQSALFTPDERPQSDVTETQGGLGGLPGLSASTRAKRASGGNKPKKSLAAKLNCLKKHGAGELLQRRSGSTSWENTRLDSPEDSNNNRTAEPRAEDHAEGEEGGEGGEGEEGEEAEEASLPGDWLTHFDTSVGRTVYVNKATGLSRYEEPPTEETHAGCTSDITNMAVSVVSETGMEYRCYPFQAELVRPFLPKSRAERVLSSGTEDRGTSHGDTDENVDSLSLLYSKWNNPVFVRPPTVAMDITSGQAGRLEVKIHNILFPYRFSKAMINSMKVIQQVDKKFLACLINTRAEDSAEHSEAEGNLLVLLDQHAAHERVRLENLVADSYEDDPVAPGERRLCSSNIMPPLEICVKEEELRLLRSFQAHLRRLGLDTKFPQAAEPRVLVGKVPRCFVEKERNELKRGRPSVIKPLVEEYLREQLELLHSTGRVGGTLPLTVLKVLASLACHGAVKFNDSLSTDECRSLVASLSSCQLPFQCAHGRPSIAPLVDVLHLDQKEEQKPNLSRLRRMCRAWELFGNK